nr:aldo/keto reductase [Lachnospiraceae bacterium]
MEYRILGKTGLKISRMGFGGIPIQKIDAEGTKALMKRLCEEGINFIDTARAYTCSEEYLGYALDGMRDKFIIATKSGAQSKEDMLKDIDVSLKNLRTDYIDLYQLHNPKQDNIDFVLSDEGALAALKEAKAAGKIGHIGITTHSTEVFEKAFSLDCIETIMFPYNIVESQGEELIKKCAEKNIG